MEHRILYDDDCGFCRWSLALFLRWDRDRRLRPVALQDPRAAPLLAGYDAERRMATWHLVAPDGSVTSGGLAAIPLLRLLPGGRPLAAAAARVPWLLERGYALVAAHRSRLSKLVGEGPKARAERLIASRAQQAPPPPP